MDSISHDTDGVGLLNELTIFCQTLNKRKTTLKCLVILKMVCNLFSNISIVLRIMFTMLVRRTASVERSFSKLKII